MKEIELSYIYKVKKAWSEWATSEDWNIFGTLNFSLDKQYSFDEALRKWAYFWNTIDQLCYGQSKRSQLRIARFVYAHRGRNNDNPHIHFMAKVDCDVKEFCILLNAIWASLDHVGGAIADQNEVLPIFSKDKASVYLMHEDRGYKMNGFCETLSHLPKEITPLPINALDKLRAAANRYNQSKDAAIAFDKHLERAEKRYIRRNAK